MSILINGLNIGFGGEIPFSGVLIMNFVLFYVWNICIHIVKTRGKIVFCNSLRNLSNHTVAEQLK